MGATAAGIEMSCTNALGDWTERLARDVEHGRAPARLWVRRMCGYGFMYHAQAYRRVLMVATGAGIGPVLPYVAARVADVAHHFDAVFVVSNDVVRDAVARACESLGVPWYGPTFDS
jgi:ferredoxin-NADP reductase